MSAATQPSQRLPGRLRELMRRRPSVMGFAIAAVLFAAGTIHSLDFASINQIKTMLVYGTFVGIIGLGQTLCILTGGIDLSVPATLTGAAVMVTVITDGANSGLAGAVALVFAGSILVGFLNGLGVAYAGVPPIIMTLGMNGAVAGLILVSSEGGVTPVPPSRIGDFVNGSVLGVPTPVLIWLVVLAIGIFILSGTTLGRRLYAIGNNARAAELAGIRVRRTLVMPYMISAICAAATGLLLLGYNGQAFLSMGDPYLFASAAAVAVGGASILGGSGHYVGTVAGALVLTLVASLLPLFDLGTAWLQIAYGVILLVTVYVATAAQRPTG
jgi:ribose transport system permease protein